MEAEHVDAFGKPYSASAPPPRPQFSETDATDIIVTLVDANARMAETISAQADQIVSLSKRGAV